MLRKIIKKILLALFTIIIIYGVGRFIDVSYGSYVFVPRQPYMVMQTLNSMTIKWQTPKDEIGEVYYSDKKNDLDMHLLEKKATDKHLVKLTNLKKCTRYFYAIKSDSLKINNRGRSFTTLCQKADKQRLWVIGDSGDVSKGQKEVYDSMLKYIDNNFTTLNMWVLLGDNAYRSGTQAQYNKALFTPYIELVKRFVPWAVTGNHDARRWAFYDIWDFPKNGESGGVISNSDEYYSIDNGNLHLVMLDSEHPSLSSDGDMALWLKEDLKQNKKPWVIVAFHTPPYTDGGHKSDDFFNSRGRMTYMRENFVPIFDEFGVDLVLSGHSHGYERSKLIINHLGKSDTFSKKNIVEDRKTNYIKSLAKKKNSGTIYLVCGSSAKVDEASLKHPAMPYSFERLGSLIIEITPTTLMSKFLNIDGKIADTFTITKEK